jgi:excisionase family DNA binding protein
MVHAEQPDPEWMTIREVAELLRVSEVTVSRWIKQGRLPAARVGPRALRIRRDDLGYLFDVPERGSSVPVPVRAAAGVEFRPLTEEEVAQRLEALRAADQIRLRIRRRRGGPLPNSSAEIIAEERQKRSEQLGRSS